MALSWENLVEQPSGVIAGYWVAKMMTVDLVTGVAQVNIEGYLSEDAYNHPRAPIVSQTVSIDFSAFDPEGNIAAGVVQMVQAAQG